MKKNSLWVWVVLLLATTTMTGQAQTGSPTMPTVGEVRRQVEVFDFPVWRHLRQGQRDSSVCMNWNDYLGNDYLGLDIVLAWNAVENGMARFTRFSGTDKICIVTLDDGRDVIYRERCKNRNLRVEEPVPIQQPPFEDQPTEQVRCRDTTIVIVNVQCSTTPAPVQCETCCPEDSATHTIQILAGYENRRVGYQLDPSFGIGFEVDRFSFRRNKELATWRERQLSYYGGAFASIGKKSEEFLITCDTCGYWGDIEGGMSLRVRVYAGLQYRLWQPKKSGNLNSGVSAFVETSYDVLNTDHIKERGKFLGDENIAMLTGLKGQIALPDDFPIVRALDFRAGMLGSTYAKPDKSLGVSAGGFAGVYAVVGAKPEEVRVKEKIQRDSLSKEQFLQDSTEQANFLVQNSDSIAIDTIELGQDSADTKKIRQAKEELLKLQQDYNVLLQRAKDDYVVWVQLQKNIQAREDAEQTLSKLTEQKANRESRKAERKARQAERVQPQSAT